MILEKNNLTVQEWNKFYIELLNSLICTPKNSNHVRSQKIRPGKQIDLFVYCICISCCFVNARFELLFSLIRMRIKIFFKISFEQLLSWWSFLVTVTVDALAKLNLSQIEVECSGAVNNVKKPVFLLSSNVIWTTWNVSNQGGKEG